MRGFTRPSTGGEIGCAGEGGCECSEAILSAPGQLLLHCPDASNALRGSSATPKLHPVFQIATNTVEAILGAPRQPLMLGRAEARRRRHGSRSTTPRREEVEPLREQRPRATQDDCMDAGGRATPGAVAEQLPSSCRAVAEQLPSSCRSACGRAIAVPGLRRCSSRLTTIGHRDGHGSCGRCATTRYPSAISHFSLSSPSFRLG
jgi:hypothetical protein